MQSAPPIWLSIATNLNEHGATNCQIDNIVTAYDAHGNARILNITISPTDVVEICTMLQAIATSPLQDAPASNFIRRDFTYSILEPPLFQHQVIRIRRWQPNASWILTPPPSDSNAP
jgi:hypothetical protein